MLKRISLVCTAFVMTVAMVLAFSPVAAFADSGAIVTIGADLTAEQKATVLEFFGLDQDDLSDLEVITVTNADEHRYCDASIPRDVTGSRTLSCSYIQPTTSGGINVKTANLTYVTSDILYNALQTAGVRNCNLVVTAPFPVSGTGALTGVFMAYEQEGNAIDSDKAEAAVEEMYETAQLEDTYGEGIVEAMGEAKDEVISATEDLSDEEIKEIVQEKAEEQGITLSEEDLNTIVSLLHKLQGLNYDLDAFSDTLASASGLLGSLSGFFSSIAGFFSGLFGGGGNILNGLDTSIFSLDN